MGNSLSRWHRLPDQSNATTDGGLIRQVYTAPTTGTRAPVTVRAAGLARNSITPARSRGVTHLAKSASGMAARLAGVSMVEGRTALTVRPRPFHSSARASVRRWTPDLDAA